MKRIKKILRKLNNWGMTLVEMIVTFMLIGLFMVAASKVIANTVMIYYEAKGVTNGMQVSGIISTKIRGEIEGARTEYLTKETVDGSGQTVEETMPYMVLLSNDAALGGGNGSSEYNKIEFIDKRGSHVYISVNADGYFVVHYFPIETEENGVSTTIPETDWVFDKKAYMGYTVKQLTFTQPKGDYENNIIHMTLTLTSDRYGDYTVTEYFQCYNFDAGTDAIRAE